MKIEQIRQEMKAGNLVIVKLHFHQFDQTENAVNFDIPDEYLGMMVNNAPILWKVERVVNEETLRISCPVVALDVPLTSIAEFMVARP